MNRRQAANRDGAAAGEHKEEKVEGDGGENIERNGNDKKRPCRTPQRQTPLKTYD